LETILRNRSQASLCAFRPCVDPQPHWGSPASWEVGLKTAGARASYCARYASLLWVITSAADEARRFHTRDSSSRAPGLGAHGPALRSVKVESAQAGDLVPKPSSTTMQRTRGAHHTQPRFPRPQGGRRGPAAVRIEHVKLLGAADPVGGTAADRKLMLLLQRSHERSRVRFRLGPPSSFCKPGVRAITRNSPPKPGLSDRA
jgi:hypothetical protein